MKMMVAQMLGRALLGFSLVVTCIVEFEYRDVCLTNEVCELDAHMGKQLQKYAESMWKGDYGR